MEWCRKSESVVLVFYYCCNKLLQTQWTKTIHIYSLIFKRSEVQNQSLWSQDMVLLELVPLGGFGESLLLCLFPSLKTTSIPWPLEPSCIFNASNIASSILSLSLSLFQCFPCHIISAFDPMPTSYKDPCDYTIRTTCRILANLPISRLLITAIKFIFLYRITYSQVLVIRMWTFFGKGALFSLQ